LTDQGLDQEGLSKISGEQSKFKRSPYSGYAIEIGPSGLAFLIFLALILKIMLFRLELEE
jgi:hypothetical protein